MRVSAVPLRAAASDLRRSLAFFSSVSRRFAMSEGSKVGLKDMIAMPRAHNVRCVLFKKDAAIK